MKSILSFALKPSLPTKSFSVKTKIIFSLHGFLFLLLARFLVTLVMLTEKASSIEGIKEILESHESFKYVFDSIPLILTVVLIGPVVEEIAFRGLFTRNKNLILISLAVFAVLILTIIYQGSALFNNSHTYIQTFISVILVILIFMLLTKYRDTITGFISSNMTFVIFISVILFSFMHLINYDLPPLSVYQMVMLPVAMIPYLSLAIVMSFLRIYCGLVWAIAFHMLNNSVVLLISYMAIQ